MTGYDGVVTGDGLVLTGIESVMTSKSERWMTINVFLVKTLHIKNPNKDCILRLSNSVIFLVNMNQKFKKANKINQPFHFIECSLKVYHS